MLAALQGFFAIAVVIGTGVLLAHKGLVDAGAQRLLSVLAFYVATPALMVVLMSETDVSRVASGAVVATIAGVVVPVMIYLVTVVVWFRRRRQVDGSARLGDPRPLGKTVIGALCSAYVNAGNLGLPVAAYVLGDAALIAPTLILQLLVLQPLALILLDYDARGEFSWRAALAAPFKNVITVATLIGIGLSVLGWQLPDMLRNPLDLLGGMAVPSMLIAYGIALRLGGGFGAGGNLPEVITISVLKSVVQPLTAYLVAAHVLDLSAQAVFAVTVTSALPTAQNVFTHAVRYGRAELLARDVILITTITTVPLVLLLTFLLH